MMPTPQPDERERTRARAERSLRFRSAILGGIFKFVGFLIVVSWFVAWITWGMNPGVLAWVQALAAQVASSTSTDALIQIKMQLLAIPGGFPWPLIWMFASAIAGTVLRALLALIFNYADFKQIDEANRMYDTAMRRELRGMQYRQGIVNPLLDMFSEYAPVAENVRDEVQRRADKIRRWIQMYNEVPDTYSGEPVEKTKGKIKRDQTVRLSDDGELIFEDEPLHDTSNTSASGRDE